MNQLTEKQIETIAKSTAISIIGALSTYGGRFTKKKIIELKNSIKKDIKSGSFERSEKQFDEITN